MVAQGVLGPDQAPPLDRILLVAWDMPAGTLKGWDLAREDQDPSHWSAKLSAEEVGFGCDERYATGFFLMGTWADKVSRSMGLQRVKHDAFDEDVWPQRYPQGTKDVWYDTWFNFVKAGVPAPDMATYYLQDLFTGTTFRADVPADANGSSRKTTHFIADYGKLGFGTIPDVAAGVVYTREGNVGRNAPPFVGRSGRMSLSRAR